MVDIDTSSADVNICKIKANISSSDVNISKIKADTSSADADAQGFEFHFCDVKTHQSGEEMVCKKHDFAKFAVVLRTLLGRGINIWDFLGKGSMFMGSIACLCN